MCKSGSPPKAPTPPPAPPPPPPPVDENIATDQAKARQDERNRAALAQGRKAMMISGGLVDKPADTTAKKQVLGA